MEDGEDEMDSLQINYDRFPIDLPNISKPAFCTDEELKACRYLLFKIAKFATDHFIPWKKHVLEKTDREKRATDSEGLRHDITGRGHPIEMTTITENGVEREEPIYKNGLYITVSDQTAYEHYNSLYLRKKTQNPPDENLRRYRFSVVVNKLTETLYRLGYELEKDGDFGVQVRICNSAGEPTGDAVMRTVSEIMRAYGTVEHAMIEAITCAFDATSFSFFSEAQTIGHYKFNVQELQSYILFKNRGRANKEMMHVMHCHGVEYVPLFREHMEKVYMRDADEPQGLKFLANTPLAQRQGFNMLMPVPANQQEWRPRVRENPSAASSSIPPWRSHQAQARRIVRHRVRWVPSGIYGNTEGAWNELWRRYPNAEGDDDFWYDPPSGEWFVKEYL